MNFNRVLIEAKATPISHPHKFVASLEKLPNDWKHLKTWQIGDIETKCYLKTESDGQSHAFKRFKERFVDVDGDDMIDAANGMKIKRSAIEKMRNLEFKKLNWKKDFIPMLKSALRKINTEYELEPYAYLIHSTKNSLVIPIIVKADREDKNVRFVIVRSALHYAWDKQRVRDSDLDYATRNVVVEELRKLGYLIV